MDTRRSKKRFVLNRRWALETGAAALVSVLGLVGIVMVRADVLARSWAYFFVAMAVLGAVGASVGTIVRGYAGDQVDE